MFLLAQVTAPAGAPVPMSGDWSSPASWGDLFVKAGVPAAVLCFVLLFFGALVVLSLWWTIGPKGFVRDLAGTLVARLHEFLTKIEEGITASNAALTDHMERCSAQHAPGGPSYAAPLLHAAPRTLEGLREMANAMELPEAVAHFSAAADQLHAPPTIAAQ